MRVFHSSLRAKTLQALLVIRANFLRHHSGDKQSLFVKQTDRSSWSYNQIGEVSFYVDMVESTIFSEQEHIHK